MKNLRSYLYTQRVGLIGTLVGFLFFLVVCVLGGLFLAVGGYGLLLALFFVAVAHSYGFYRYHQKVERLEETGKDSGALPLTFLPSQDNTERAYQRIAKELYRQNKTLKAQGERQQQELSDYYTLWVHQIKTPIAALDLLLQGQEGGERKTHMRRELLHIEQYAEMALQYIRLDSFSSDLVLAPHNLRDLVSKVVRRLSLLFIEKDLSVTLKEMNYRLVTDEKWFAFALEQILTNAAKYTASGGVTVSLEESTLMIVDTGTGIAPEDLPRIFQKGFTGYSGRMDKKASGLGLPMTHTILSRLGHPISITSQQGKGTQVAINLEQTEVSD